MTTSPKCDPKELLLRRVPILAWLPIYTWSKLLQDSLAGVTVGLTAIPQGIAYAIIAGLPAQYGLYSGFMGCFVYLIFGSCKDVTVGPTAIMALMSQPYVTRLGPDFAVLLCFLSGCLITAMGLLQFGFLVDFISMPVISGFTTAAAITIASSQFPTILGIPGRTDSIIDSVFKVFENLSKVEPWDTTLGLSSVVLLVLLKSLPGSRSGNVGRKIMWIICLSRNAVVVFLGIILAYYMSLEGLEPFRITGNITEGLPPIGLPPFATVHANETYNFPSMVKELGGSLITVPLIAILESIAIAKAFAKGKSLDANQEMLALGLCNIFGSFARSMPVTGSFTRTAVNNASGVRTTMGGVVTGLLVLLALGLLTSTFKFIPKASLAAVIIVAMYYMLEFHVFRVLWKTKKVDLVPLTVTLICCLAFGLEKGMMAGIVVNLAVLLYFVARPGLSIEERAVDDLLVIYVSPKQSLSFPAAEYLRDQVVIWCEKRKDPIPVVVDGRYVHRIDATVAKNLRLLHQDLEARHTKLIFWNWCDETRETLTRYESALSVHFCNSATLSQIFAGSDEPARTDFQV